MSGRLVERLPANTRSQKHRDSRKWERLASSGCDASSQGPCCATGEGSAWRACAWDCRIGSGFHTRHGSAFGFSWGECRDWNFERSAVIDMDVDRDGHVEKAPRKSAPC